MTISNFFKTLLLSALLCSGASWAASFDCNSATRPVEKTICADTELSNLDEKLNQSYQSALVKNPEIKFSQREWLKAINQCNTDALPTECLRRAFKARIQVLNHVANPNVGTLGIEILGLYRINGQNGLQVGNVTPNGSGYNAGILSGDFIVEINNRKIEDINQVMDQLSIAPGQSILLKIVKKDNSERIVQVKMGSRADVTTQPAIEQNPTASASEKPAATIESVNQNSNTELANNETKAAEKKNDAIPELKASNNMGWLAALIVSLGVAAYYFKQQKSKPQKQVTTQKTSPKDSTAIPKKTESIATETVSPAPEPLIEATQKPTKEDLLKQQQLDAFKKLK